MRQRQQAAAAATHHWMPYCTTVTTYIHIRERWVYVRYSFSCILEWYATMTATTRWLLHYQRTIRDMRDKGELNLDAWADLQSSLSRTKRRLRFAFEWSVFNARVFIHILFIYFVVVDVVVLFWCVPSLSSAVRVICRNWNCRSHNDHSAQITQLRHTQRER